MGGVGIEVWFGRLQLSGAVNTISLQGWWSTQAVKLVKEGWAPIFGGGDANLARWAVHASLFRAPQLQILWASSTRCHKDVADGMFHVRHRIESITREREKSQAGMFQPRVQQARKYPSSADEACQFCLAGTDPQNDACYSMSSQNTTISRVRLGHSRLLHNLD